jgi:hypothetical protein
MSHSFSLPSLPPVASFHSLLWKYVSNVSTAPEEKKKKEKKKKKRVIKV